MLTGQTAMNGGRETIEMALLTHQIIVAILLIKSFLMIMMNDQKRVPPQFPRVHNYHLPPVSF